MTSDSPVGLDRFCWRHPPRNGRTLVVGSKVYGKKQDRRELYRKAVGVDLFEGDGVDFVHDMETPLPESVGTFAHVDCVSVLEHVRRPWLMAANIVFITPNTPPAIIASNCLSGALMNGA